MSDTTRKIRVLMIGTDQSTGGGMWTVAKNYINSELYNQSVTLKYIPTFVVGSNLKRISFALMAYIKILCHLIARRPQVLHVHMAEKGSVYRKGIAIRMAKKFDCKIIIHMHGAEFQTWFESLPEEIRQKVTSIINLADKIIILGHYWENFIGKIVPEDKIDVVYNAVEQNNNNYNPDGSTILFLGAVGKRKGAYDLVKAFEQAKDSIPDKFKLKYYGPDFEHQIEKVIENSTAKSRIQYCGWLDKENREKVLADTVCNVLPSYNEGLPMTILETMAAGIPNISTEIAAIPEVLNNENGILITPGDVHALSTAIIDICTNRENRIGKSKEAYNEIKRRFTIDKNVESVISIYRELL